MYYLIIYFEIWLFLFFEGKVCKNFLNYYRVKINLILMRFNIDFVVLWDE